MGWVSARTRFKLATPEGQGSHVGVHAVMPRPIFQLPGLRGRCMGSPSNFLVQCMCDALNDTLGTLAGACLRAPASWRVHPLERHGARRSPLVVFARWMEKCR